MGQKATKTTEGNLLSEVSYERTFCTVNQEIPSSSKSHHAIVPINFN